MKTTSRLISLFAALSISATLLADDIVSHVKYEPLIIESGFNLDVIAENTPPASYAWSPLYDRTGSNAHTSCSATKEVMLAINQARIANLTDEELSITERCGWPNEYTDTVRCDELVCTNQEYRDVKFLLAPYDTENALCLRPETGFQRTGTLHFKKIGCYNKLYFLMISLQEKGDKKDRRSNVKIYFTNGTKKDTTFNFGGLSASDATPNKFRLTNIYEYSDFEKNIRGNTAAYACVYDIAIPDSLLVDSIWFENPKINSSVSIYAITGRTADIAAPEEEAAHTSSVQENSFEACWDYIADAASYRLDVAEDIDFQRLVEGYNNLNVGNATCREVAGLLADNDYYWRVRSVNSDGGQSASSTPVRVKTAGGETPVTDETHSEIANELEAWLDQQVSSITIGRTLYRDGAYNTLCLPFDLNTAEIAASPLAGAQVYKFVRATKIGDAQLDIEVEDTTGIKAGVPYLIKWDPTTPEIIDNGILIFENVYIKTNVGQTIGADDEVRFVGNISRAQMENGDHDNLFIGANNILYWPNTNNKLKGFRAYFKVPKDGKNAVPHNTPARIVVRQDTPTDIDQITYDQSPITNKIIKDNRLIILRDGKRYNVLGYELK